MTEAAIASLGRIDILVNNAGIRIRHPFGEYSAADFDQLIAVNLRAPFLASQAVVPSMRANGGGRIITIASQNGIVAAANSALYGVSKAALIYLTKAMAFELAKDNITVNAVSPGPIETEFTRARMEREPGHRELRASQVPVKRWGKPEEIAAAVLFLASTEATFYPWQQPGRRRRLHHSLILLYFAGKSGTSGRRFPDHCEAIHVRLPSRHYRHPSHDRCRPPRRRSRGICDS